MGMKEYIIQVDDNPIWDGSRKVFETKELVRCKDCKYHGEWGCPMCVKHRFKTIDNGYCAGGERREDNERKTSAEGGE